MHGTAKVSKPQKKKRKPNDGEEIASEDRPKRGGRQLEKNTTDEMSHPDGYKTIEGETSTQRTNRLQRITRYQAKRWFNYQRLRDKYAKRFAFTPPWGGCVVKCCLKDTDPQMRLLPIPADADPSSLKTPEDYPDEVEKRREAAAK